MLGRIKQKKGHVEKKGEVDMAAPKKSVKPVAKAAETVKKAETVKVQDKEPVAVSAEAPKAKAEEKKPAEKPAAAAKKTAVRKTVKKAEQKNVLHVQYSGKSYSQDELLKMAKDVWKYDLKQKVRELASIELYVKPEENKVYYVMNDEFTGFFNI